MGFIENVRKLFSTKDLEYKTRQDARDEFSEKIKESYQKEDELLAKVKEEGAPKMITDFIKEEAKREQDAISRELANYDKTEEIRKARQEVIQQLPEDFKTDVKKAFAASRDVIYRKSIEQNVKTVSKKTGLNAEKMKQIATNPENYIKAAITVAALVMIVKAAPIVSDEYNYFRAKEQMLMNVADVMLDNDYNTVPINGEWEQNGYKIKDVNPYDAAEYGGGSLGRIVLVGKGLEPDFDKYAQSLGYADAAAGYDARKQEVIADYKDDKQLNNSVQNEVEASEAVSMGGKN